MKKQKISDREIESLRLPREHRLFFDNLRLQAIENLVSRGILTFNHQKQAYEVLPNERGKSDGG